VVLALNDQQRAKLKTFASLDDYVGGWQYLASISDA
jgi:hypothetical protein